MPGVSLGVSPGSQRGHLGTERGLVPDVGGDAWAPPPGCYTESSWGAPHPHLDPGPLQGASTLGPTPTLGGTTAQWQGLSRGQASPDCPSGRGPGWGALMHGPLALGLRWMPPWRPEELVRLTPHPWGAGPWLASSLLEAPFSAGPLGLWVVGGAEWSCWTPGPPNYGCLNPHGSELLASGTAGVRRPCGGISCASLRVPGPRRQRSRGCAHTPRGEGQKDMAPGGGTLGSRRRVGPVGTCPRAAHTSAMRGVRVRVMIRVRVRVRRGSGHRCFEFSTGPSRSQGAGWVRPLQGILTLSRSPGGLAQGASAFLGRFCPTWTWAPSTETLCLGPSHTSQTTQLCRATLSRLTDAEDSVLFTLNTF